MCDIKFKRRCFCNSLSSLFVHASWLSLRHFFARSSKKTFQALKHVHYVSFWSFWHCCQSELRSRKKSKSILTFGEKHEILTLRIFKFDLFCTHKNCHDSSWIDQFSSIFKYALSHFTKRNSSRCFFSLYYLLNIFSFIFLPRSRQGRWRSEVFLALEIWYLHWSLLLTRAEYFSEPNKLKASARFTFILFECRLSVKSLINSPHTALKAFYLSFEFQFTYDLTDAAIRAHDECIRISPLNCRQKPKISCRLREKREEKLLMSNTNTHSRRGRFHIFFSLGDFRNGGKFESMKHDFSFFFKGEISFVFLFYRLKNWLTRFATHPHRRALEFKLFRHFTAWALAEASTDSNRLLFTATQQEIKNSFSYCSGGLSKSARRATAHDWWGDIRLGNSGSIHSFGKQFWGVR